MKLFDFRIIAIVAILTLFTTYAAGDDRGDKCENICEQAAELFWEAYVSATVNNSEEKDKQSGALLSKYVGIPEDIANKLIVFANDMHEKYGNEIIAHKEEAVKIAITNCNKSCKAKYAKGNEATP